MLFTLTTLGAKKTMRRYFYYASAIVLATIFLLLLMIGEAKWFICVIIIIAGVYLYDTLQTKHTLLKNFPVIGHFRYFFESIRPEIHQYFIASDTDELPFNRDTRSAIYARAKNHSAVQPFGTDHNLYEEGAEWVVHSLAPVEASVEAAWVTIGGEECKQPYKASRLNISAMSFGALSKHAIIALNKGAKLGGFYHNTGEGGLSEYHQAGGGDLVFQIGTGYFGCRNKDGTFSSDAFKEKATLTQVKMIEIKLSQGAKPAHGGILPAAKLSEEIAQIRMVSMGQDVISPPKHTEFSTPEGLLTFVQRLRQLSGGKPTGFKLCVGRRSEFLSICKAMIKTGITPDFITIDGAEGGTGAAPQEFSNSIGLPLKEGLHFVHSALIGCGLRNKMRIICSGKIASGFDMIRVMALGADACNAARPMMMALGCLQSKQCHANTCPVGVATQNKRLYKNLVIEDKKERVNNYHRNTIKNYLEILGAVGLSVPDDIHPDLVMRRVSDVKINSYNTIYRLLSDGCLARGEVPEAWAYHWDAAAAEHF